MSNFRIASLFVYSFLFLMEYGYASVNLAYITDNNNVDSYRLDSLPLEPNSVYTLRYDWDLKGKSFYIPKGVIIKGGGGVFKNGTLIGNNTTLVSTVAVFDNVEIKGSWRVSEITSRLFKDLTRINAIKNLFALASDDIQNHIIVEHGSYYVTAESFSAAISVCSNTDVELDGVISLLPNSFDGCFVIDIRSVSNIKFHGKGTIIGDKRHHVGKTGEWGHGINIIDSKNVSITEISIKDCWGDCIYVGGASHAIDIIECSLDNGRRQGISITGADSVLISSCLIKNVSGTEPQYAIDLEPNPGRIVNNVRIENVQIQNCHGGLLLWGQKSPSLKSVEVIGCSIVGVKDKSSVKVNLAEDVIVDHCYFDSGANLTVDAKSTKGLHVSNNTIKSTLKRPIRYVECKNSKVLSNFVLQ